MLCGCVMALCGDQNNSIRSATAVCAVRDAAVYNDHCETCRIRQAAALHGLGLWMSALNTAVQRAYCVPGLLACRGNCVWDQLRPQHADDAVIRPSSSRILHPGAKCQCQTYTPPVAITAMYASI